MKTVERLEKIKEELADIRDSQEEIPCLDPDDCMCNKFDLIIDSVDELREEFIGKGE